MAQHKASLSYSCLVSLYAGSCGAFHMGNYFGDSPWRGLHHALALVALRFAVDDRKGIAKKTTTLSDVIWDFSNSMLVWLWCHDLTHCIGGKKHYVEIVPFENRNMAHMQPTFWLNLGLLQPIGRSVLLKAWLDHIYLVLSMFFVPNNASALVDQ